MKTLNLRGIVAFALAAALLAAPAFAQSTPFETLNAYRQQYPTPMSEAQIGELLNRTAWDYRDQGMKLLGKPAGANCPTPSGVRISCDYLVHGPSVTGHDVFQDAGPNGITKPVRFSWGPGKEDLASAVRSGARSIVDPTLPDSTTDPGVVVVTEPSQPGQPIASGLEELKRLPLMEQVLAELRQAVHNESLRAEAERVQAEAFRQHVRTEWGRMFGFIGKYIAPALGTGLAIWFGRGTPAAEAGTAP